ncbi:MAG TPA: ParM/StbA family protein [Roseiflexaceae bacterium]|nr:ParM/StbA family protein [Roseiflexaceae bacterium]
MTTTTQITPLARAQLQRLRAAPLALVGGDFGNATALLCDGERTVQIPSYIGSGDLGDLLTTRGGAGGAGQLLPGEYAIEYNGQVFFVGDLALAQSRDASTARADSSRYHSGHTLLLLMTLAGAMFAGDVRLRLVTGVPPGLLKERPELRDLIPEALAGEHRFVLYDERGRHDILLAVESTAVVMEGLAVLATQGEPGKPGGLVDVGGYTTDAVWIGADGQIVYSRCGSLPDAGVARIGSILSAQFRREHGRALTAGEVDQLLTNYRNGLGTTIYHRGERHIDYQAVERAIEAVAGQISTYLSQLWGLPDGSVGGDGAYVLVIGGGPYYRVAPHLRIDAPMTVPMAPEQANARAYAELAQRIEQRGSWPQRRAS